MIIKLYGLVIDVGVPLAGCSHVAAQGPADVDVSLGHLGPFAPLAAASAGTVWYTSTWGDGVGSPWLEIRHLPSKHYWFRYNDGTEFVIDEAATRIYGRWEGPYTAADALIYLFGPILGFALRLRGAIPLHGSVVAVGGRAIVFIGPPGAGKSTTAAAFARQGFAVLADDVAALADRQTTFLVHAGPPRLLLLPPSVQALWGAPDRLPLSAASWDKRSLDTTHPAFRFCPQPLPLGAVYILGERRADAGGPTVHSVGGADGLVQLVANTFANKLLNQAMRAKEFDLLTRLIHNVPVRTVRAPADLARLGDLCDTVVRDCHALGIT